MQFNSYIFICAFMPLMVIAYFAGMKIRSDAGKILLIAGSVLFYAYSDWSVLIVMGISLVFNFAFARYIEKAASEEPSASEESSAPKDLKELVKSKTAELWNKVFPAIPPVVNAALLLYFKYADFMIGKSNSWFGTEFALKGLSLPLGMSFFTFQQIAYVTAVHQKQITKTELPDYLAYILYFPKLLMGPLMDPVDFMDQLNDERRRKPDWDNIAGGIKLFSFGLLKKMLLADTFAAAVSWGYRQLETATAADWLLIMLFFTFEIYFDFSGYCDMATGASLMFNIVLPINFDSPYKAASIRDFWKRWHISLTRFFTRYIYIPLGGSRKGAVLACVNTMLVFVAGGIWHGPNLTFVLWAALHGAFCLLDRAADTGDREPLRRFRRAVADKKPVKFVRWMLTFAAVNVLWLLFRSDSIGQWAGILGTILRFADGNVSSGLMDVFAVPETRFLGRIPGVAALSGTVSGFWMIMFVLASAVICFIPDNNYRKMKKMSVPAMLLAAAAFVWGFISLGGESRFIYLGF